MRRALFNEQAGQNAADEDKSDHNRGVEQDPLQAAFAAIEVGLATEGAAERGALVLQKHNYDQRDCTENRDVWQDLFHNLSRFNCLFYQILAWIGRVCIFARNTGLEIIENFVEFVEFGHSLDVA